MAAATADRVLQRVAVVGAGITGLAAAHRLISRLSHVQVDVLESSGRAGGIIRTETRDGFLIEHGPDAFITNKPGALELCEELGLSDQLIGTEARYRRSLVVHKGRPKPIPDGFQLMAPSRPAAILTTPVLSIAGRLRLLADIFLPRRKSGNDESVASFVRRRFGSETLDRLVQPLVGGIYTSDPETLSLKATLPRFLEMEREYGSVIRGTLAGRRNDPSDGTGARYGLFATPRNGLESLIQRLLDALHASQRLNIQLSTRVIHIDSCGTDSGWVLSLDSTQSGVAADINYDAVILTTPAHVSAQILQSVGDGLLAEKLKQIEYASSAVITSAHRLTDFAHPLDAFGMVIPAKENRNVLAVSFSSRKFAGRAPEGCVLLRSFVGGALQPHVLDRTDDGLTDLVTSELTELLGLRAPPIFSVATRYHQAMPQYHVGHLDHVETIDRLASELPNLELAGNAFRGVGIPDCISSGRAAADRLADTAA